MIEPAARGAWRDLEQRLRPFVARRVASAADVEDVLQDIFVRMHRGLVGLREGERFGAWVYRVARNAVADAHRRQARSRLVIGEEAPDRAAAEQPEEADELESDLGACVVLFVARLPSPYREAITLTEIQGLTQKDAAEVLGISLPGMKSRVQRGREKIRAMFEECCIISTDCRGRITECAPRTLAGVPEDCRPEGKARPG